MTFASSKDHASKASGNGQTRVITISFGESATGTQTISVPGRTASAMLRAAGFREGPRWNHGTKELGVVAWKQRWQKGKERQFTSYRRQRDVPVPLLNATKVSKAQEVWLSESHSDADALCAAGVIGTTNWGGAHNWNDEDAAQLRGKRIVIVEHFDKAGREFVRDVQASLPGEEIRVVIPATGKDARDHLEAGYGISDFIEAS